MLGGQGGEGSVPLRRHVSRLSLSLGELGGGDCRLQMRLGLEKSVRSRRGLGRRRLLGSPELHHFLIPLRRDGGRLGGRMARLGRCEGSLCLRTPRLRLQRLLGRHRRGRTPSHLRERSHIRLGRLCLRVHGALAPQARGGSVLLCLQGLRLRVFTSLGCVGTACLDDAQLSFLIQ